MPVHLINLLVLGEKHVGKTALLNRFVPESQITKATLTGKKIENVLFPTFTIKSEISEYNLYGIHLK